MIKSPTKYTAAVILAIATGIFAAPTLAQSAPRHRAANVATSSAFQGDVYNATGPIYSAPVFSDSYEGPARSQMEHVTGN